VNMNDGEMDEFWMEPAEKMSAMLCACMPFWLGDNVSHIAGDGGVITNASSSHLWLEDIEGLVGRIIGAMR
jgi:hypothetical protein